MGRWIDDPREPSGFRYDRDAEPLGQAPAIASLPTPYPRDAVDYDEHRDYPVVPAPLDLVDVPPRVDDWCEDRPPSELTDRDGTD